MREILFRGKRIDNGEWVEGYLVPITINCYDKGYEIIESDGIEYDELDGYNPLFSSSRVDPATVGQYTGFLDKNGKRIYEGDILAFPDTGEVGYEYKEGYDFTNVATVCWNNGRWELDDFGDENSGVKDDMEYCRHEDFIEIFPCSEVIGNIHDNPELIGGKEE